MSVQFISLYFREGSSDKVYQCAIEPAGPRFVVNFAYGRRGSTLNTGTKTNVPVELDVAEKIFEKLVREKMAKGYTEGEAGTPYQHTDQENRISGLLPQLLNPIEESEVETLIEDDNWCAQEKFDGKRVLIQKEGSAIHGINRKGLLIGLPSTIVHAASAFRIDFIIDGECIGEQFHAFDILLHNGSDLRDQTYDHRAADLLNLLGSGQQQNIRLVNTAWTAAEKEQLLDMLKQDRKEGIVFKRTDAPYVAGRPNSGGTQLKHKFYATASVIVGSLNRQRSVGIKLMDGADLVDVGNVTIPPNHQIPQIGQVVEVRYLYAIPDSRALYQPTFFGVRSDVIPTECRVSQLKFKPEEDL
jgi:bifunctional non-homologous end joining protein LigD